MAGPVNVSAQFAADRLNYIQKKTLRLAVRQLLAYQFATKVKLPKGYGFTYTATRWNRLPLPYAPLSEGVPPSGETMTIQQVSAVAQQWGDKVTSTDVAMITTLHNPYKESIKLCSYQIAETYERNTYLNLMGGTQVNFVNARGSRPALQTGDVLDPHTINRTVVALKDIGAPRFMGDKETDAKIDAGKGQPRAGASPRTRPHYVAIASPNVLGDFSENSTVVTAWSYSEINKLYNDEVGEWRGIRFCESNMVPYWTGYAQVNGTNGTAGNLATGTYYIVVTGQDTQNQYESYIAAVSNSISVTGPTGSISVTLPSTPNYTYQVYVGTTNSPVNLGLSSSGPTSGPLTGVATQMTAGSTVVITGIGPAQVPPSYPGNATGLTVYPTFVFGDEAYAQVELDGLEMFYLDGPDKSDPNNQLRIVGWKSMYGTLLQQVLFMARIESVSAFSQTFG